ncbi:hypothetical protein G5C60_32045 [Streptomyces sp. HC44]|uniref:Uncharacterized protein n=1 Tax=Streptomyces scabichelini TaxID=2711217 RepID=A0A6G4VE81_9ACTN|nr:hypothetical protein [Streptomyces scabichelini]NGO12114.1 hypothetical protein [Streptomyces scabichelini]
MTLFQRRSQDQEVLEAGRVPHTLTTEGDDLSEILTLAEHLQPHRQRREKIAGMRGRAGVVGRGLPQTSPEQLDGEVDISAFATAVVTLQERGTLRTPFRDCRPVVSARFSH